MPLISQSRLKGFLEFLETFRYDTISGSPNSKWSKFSGSDAIIVDNGDGTNSLRFTGPATYFFTPDYNPGILGNPPAYLSFKFHGAATGRLQIQFRNPAGTAVTRVEINTGSLFLNGFNTGYAVPDDFLLEIHFFDTTGIKVYANGTYLPGPYNNPVPWESTLDRLEFDMFNGNIDLDFIYLEKSNTGLEYRSFTLIDNVFQAALEFSDVFPLPIFQTYLYHVPGVGLVSTPFNDPLDRTTEISGSTMALGDFDGNPETGLGDRLVMIYNYNDPGGGIRNYKGKIFLPSGFIQNIADLVVTTGDILLDVVNHGITGFTAGEWLAILQNGATLKYYSYNAITNTWTAAGTYTLPGSMVSHLYAGGFGVRIDSINLVNWKYYFAVQTASTNYFIEYNRFTQVTTVISSPFTGLILDIKNPIGTIPVATFGIKNNILIDRRTPFAPGVSGIAYIVLKTISANTYFLFLTVDGGATWNPLFDPAIPGFVYIPTDRFYTPETVLKPIFDGNDNELLLYTEGKESFFTLEKITIPDGWFSNLFPDYSFLVSLGAFNLYYDRVLDETKTNAILIAHVTKHAKGSPANLELSILPRDSDKFPPGAFIDLYDGLGNLSYRGRVQYPQDLEKQRRTKITVPGLDLEFYTKFFLNLNTKTTTATYLKTLIDEKLKFIAYTSNSIRDGDFTLQYKRKIQEPFQKFVNTVRELELMATYTDPTPILYARPRDDLIYSGRIWDNDNPRIKMIRPEILEQDITRSEVVGASNNLGQVRKEYKGDPDKEVKNRPVRITKSDKNILNFTECEQYALNRFKIYANTDNPPGNTNLIYIVKIRTEFMGYVQVGETVYFSWDDGFYFIPPGFYTIMSLDKWELKRDINEIVLVNNIVTPKELKSVNRSRNTDEDLQSTFTDGEAEPTADGIEMDQQPVNDIIAVPPGGRVNKSNTLDSIPGTGQDITQGYNVGDIIVYTTTGDGYLCITNGTGTATWKKIT